MELATPTVAAAAKAVLAAKQLRAVTILAGTVVGECWLCGVGVYRILYRTYEGQREPDCLSIGKATCCGVRICEQCDSQIHRQPFPRRKLRETNPRLAEAERDWLAGRGDNWHGPRYVPVRAVFHFHSDQTVTGDTLPLASQNCFDSPPAAKLKRLTLKQKDARKKERITEAHEAGKSWAACEEQQRVRSLTFARRVDGPVMPSPADDFAY